MLRTGALLSAAAALVICEVLAARLPPTRAPRPPAQDARPAAREPEGRRRASAGGVSLTYDAALAREVGARVAPAAPLESATDKPDGFWPERVVFDLSAAYPAPPSRARPEIHVCPVEEFRRAAAVSEDLQRQVGATVRDLRLLLRRQPAAPRGEIPTLPFPDGQDAFRAHLKYLRFRKGAGVAYLTQGQQDAGLINNGQLTYEFRGLTDDGRHYVYASFPVAAPFLPADRGGMTHDGYTLPTHFYGERERENARAYRAYVARIKARLERHPPGGFTPSLRLIDEMLGSLEVNK